MAIVRLDKVKASYAGNIESFKAFDGAGGTAVAINNGVPVMLNGLMTDEREVYEALEVDNSNTAEVLLHATPEVMYESKNIALDDFQLKADKAGRAYHLSVGDVFTVTLDIVTETNAPDVDNYLVADDNNAWMWESVAAIPTPSRFVAEIIEETTLGYDQDDAIAVRVIQTQTTRV